MIFTNFTIMLNLVNRSYSSIKFRNGGNSIYVSGELILYLVYIYRLLEISEVLFRRLKDWKKLLSP